MSESLNNDLKTFFPDPVIVKIADREKKEVVEFEIKEFVFSNRVNFIKLVSQIFSGVMERNIDFAKLSPAEAVPILIDVAGDKLGEIYSLVLNRPIEWVQVNVTLKKEIEIIKAIFEVNDIPLLISQISNATKKAAVGLAQK